MFNVELFYNTGYDAVNIPESPDLLYNNNTKRSSTTSGGSKVFYFPALDIFQIDFLNEIKIKVRNEDDVIGADYLCLYEDIPAEGSGVNLVSAHQKRAFYAVVGYTMTSPDVAVLHIVQDALNTVGGVYAIDIVDGTTERHHVDAAQDQFGAYTEDDPLLVPLDPIEILHSGETMLETDAYHGTDLPAGGYTTNTPSGIVSVDGTKWFRDPPAALGEESQNGIGVQNDGYTGMFMDVESRANNKSTHVTDWNYGRTIILSTVNLHRMDDPTVVTPVYSGEVYEAPDVPQATQLIVQLPSPFVDPLTLVPILDQKRAKVDGSWPGQWMPRLKILDGIGAFERGVNAVGTDKYASDQALANLRALGMDDSIINSYELHPMAGMLRGESGGVGDEYYYSVLYGFINLFCTYDRPISLGPDGKPYYNGSAVRRMTNSQVYDYLFRKTRNMRAMYGKFRRYILASPATGNKTEANPEDLIYSPFSDSDGGFAYNDYAPTLAVLTDPSPDGCPYFNFVMRRQAGGQNNQYRQYASINVLQNAVKGAPWKEVPVKFSEMSGALKDKYSYLVASEYADYQTGEYYNQVKRAAGSANIGSVAQGVTSSGIGGYMATGSPAGAVVSGGMSFISSMMDEIKTSIGYQTRDAGALGDPRVNQASAAEELRRLQRNQELSQFNLAHAYATPSVKFIPGDSARDLNTNAVMYVRMSPSLSDMQRFDDILDRFGYKITEKMQHLFLTNHNNQNYIKGNGIKVIMRKTVPYIEHGAPAIMNRGWADKTLYRGSKQLLDEVANQLNGGIRIWHVPRLGLDGTPANYY